MFYKPLLDSKILTNEGNAQSYQMVVDQLQTKSLNFQFIYRGTQDGFKDDDFWNKCDGLKPAFVIIETIKITYLVEMLLLDLEHMTKIQISMMRMHFYIQSEIIQIIHQKIPHIKCR